jgi:hypothetical protein
MISKAANRCFLVSKDVVIPLNGGAAIVLGRDPALCNSVLPDERVSRIHAMVLFKDGQYLLKDLNSSNGTYLNGQKISGTPPLHAGDLIEIRPFTLEFVKPDYAQDLDSSTDQTIRDLVSRSKLEGSLGALPITDLIQLLNTTLQSGVLTVNDPDQQSADLVFTDGEIIQAFYRGKAGEEAVFALLRNREGRFEFTRTEPLQSQRRIRNQPGATGPVDMQVSAADKSQGFIRAKTQSLLLEGVRQIDESSGGNGH